MVKLQANWKKYLNHSGQLFIVNTQLTRLFPCAAVGFAVLVLELMQFSAPPSDTLPRTLRELDSEDVAGVCVFKCCHRNSPEL